ncbi:MAG: hypothetical protein WC227_02460 [Patescibacteria group bacterium]|jgi:hypothetical protein
MRKHIYEFILILVLSLFALDKAFADAGRLPEMMVGQTTVTSPNSVSYGGMTGNYAVYNEDATLSYGFNIGNLKLSNAADSCLAISNPICFVLGKGLIGADSVGNAGKLMTSRTYVDVGDGQGPITRHELPALFLGTNTIMGDTFGLSSSLFDYWGKNTVGSGGDIHSTGATWEMQNYTLNPNSQMAWDGTSNNYQFGKFDDKLQNMAESAVSIGSTALNGNNLWNLCGENLTDSYDAATSCSGYPEGKTWVVDGDLDLTASSARTIQFQGVGTIIVNGDIKIGANINIQSMDNKMLDKIGFIANGGVSSNGDCSYGGGGSINAMLFCKETMTIGPNSEMTGSFVAKNFSDPTNVSFFFDYNLDGKVPPGFRTLIVPKSNEVGNKP